MNLNGRHVLAGLFAVSLGLLSLPRSAPADTTSNWTELPGSKGAIEFQINTGDTAFTNGTRQQAVSLRTTLKRGQVGVWVSIAYTDEKGGVRTQEGCEGTLSPGQERFFSSLCSVIGKPGSVRVTAKKVEPTGQEGPPETTDEAPNILGDCAAYVKTDQQKESMNNCLRDPGGKPYQGRVCVVVDPRSGTVDGLKKKLGMGWCGSAGAIDQNAIMQCCHP